MIRLSLLALPAVVLALAGVSAQAADGRQLFLDNCSACHMPNGKGVPGAFPALSGSKVALGPAPAAAGIVLNGKGGMPAFRDEMSDAEIAAVLSYVRAAWGNKAPGVTAALVAPVRRTGKRENPKAALTAH
jgi:mono/diheme cytochrome c family protein